MKLNCHEHVRTECGPVIGTNEREAAGIHWKTVDVREWYHAMRRGIFKHAFASSFGMMEMLMRANAEKRSDVQNSSRNGRGE